MATPVNKNSTAQNNQIINGKLPKAKEIDTIAVKTLEPKKREGDELTGRVTKKVIIAVDDAQVLPSPEFDQIVKRNFEGELGERILSFFPKEFISFSINQEGKFTMVFPQETTKNLKSSHFLVKDSKLVIPKEITGILKPGEFSFDKRSEIIIKKTIGCGIFSFDKKIAIHGFHFKNGSIDVYNDFSTKYPMSLLTFLDTFSV